MPREKARTRTPGQKSSALTVRQRRLLSYDVLALNSLSLRLKNVLSYASFVI